MSFFEKCLCLFELQNAILLFTPIYCLSPPLNAKSTILFNSSIRLECSIFVYRVLKSNVEIYLAPLLLLILFNFSITGIYIYIYIYTVHSSLCERFEMWTFWLCEHAFLCELGTCSHTVKL